VTRYRLQSLSFINLLVLIAGSFKVLLMKNLENNGYFVLVAGNVTRQQIIELSAWGSNPEGGVGSIS
jgi:hypothetical protein